VTAVERTPFYFGNESRALFGWLHAPKNEARDLVVVICPPVGHEYINAHRSLRRLADELALAGVAAFRFDYDGCGDSAGSDEDADRMGAWRSSVVEAFREAKRASRCSRIAAVGLRMGATLAALVSEHEALDALVLWAPCVRGRGYVRELKALAMTGGNRNAGSADGAIEPGGFTFSKDTQAGLACLDLSAAPPSARQIFISPRDDLPDDGALYTAWSAAGRRVEQRSLPGFAGMVDVPHNTVVPERAIAEIVGWLAARAGGEITLRRPPSLRQSFTANGVRETIVHVRGEHGFFGILCEPVNAARGPVVLLSNAGATHHVGPNRLYVMAARALAAAGLRSLRLDLPGLGDNPAPDAEAENRPYVPSASAVIASAVAALRQRRASERFVLMGLCSGAHASFHAALDLDDSAITECVLINPLTFYYKPGMSLDQPASNHYEEWQRYMRSMRSVSGWAKLFRDDVSMTSIARNVLLRFRDIARNKVAGVREALHGRSIASGGDNLDADLRRIAAARRRVTFVFSRFDPGYDLLMINASRAVRSLTRRGMLSLWRIDDANHTFEAKRSRDAMIGSIADHLARTYSQ